MTEDEFEVLHKRMFTQMLNEMAVHTHVPWWKRGMAWFFDHAMWHSLERLGGFVLGVILGAGPLAHPLLSYDLIAHWLKAHLP